MSTTPIPDAVILAAIERATLHEARLGAPIWTILEHLDLPRRTRRVRPQMRALHASGALVTSRVRGVEVWSVTVAGRRLLLRAGTVELPESPQHRKWRAARTLAEQEIGRFRSAMADLLAEASALLDGPEASDAWFEMADHLRRAAWRLGSATYCLCQGSEPSDEQADIDDHTTLGDELAHDDELVRRRARRSGRRNTTLWRDDR
jgi:hypothetical protein